PLLPYTRLFRATVESLIGPSKGGRCGDDRPRPAERGGHGRSLLSLSTASVGTDVPGAGSAGQPPVVLRASRSGSPGPQSGPTTSTVSIGGRGPGISSTVPSRSSTAPGPAPRTAVPAGRSWAARQPARRSGSASGPGIGSPSRAVGSICSPAATATGASSSSS